MNPVDVKSPERTPDAPGPQPGRRFPRTIVGGLIGLLSGAVAIGVAQLAAGVVGGASSPIIAVGSSAIDATPEWLKSFAIRTFGSHDKLALLVGIDVLLAVAALVLGVLSVRRSLVGIVGLVGFGMVGALAAVSRPANGIGDAIPTVVGTAAGIGAFVLLRRSAGLDDVPATEASAERSRNNPPQAPAVDRRRVLWTRVVGASVAGVSGGG